MSSKLPKTLAAAADELFKVRADRLALQKDVDALQARETELSEHLIGSLPKSDATGVAGKLCRVTVVSKTIVSVTDWPAYYGYIAANAKKNPGIWSLLQKRVGETAVKEMWEAGKTVPGAERMLVPKLSINKV
jgi:hypothetical protein